MTKYLNEFKKIGQGIILIASISTLTTYAVIDKTVDYQQLHTNIQKVREANNLQSNYAYIKNISINDFNSYQEYLKTNKSIYDTQVNLTIESITKARKQKNKNLEFIDLDNINLLKSSLKDHQDNIQNIINQSHLEYYNIIGLSPNISIEATQNFIDNYNLFLNKKRISNNVLDDIIRDNFATTLSGNLKYNIDNNMYSKMEEANRNANLAINSIDKTNKGMKL